MRVPMIVPVVTMIAAVTNGGCFNEHLAARLRNDCEDGDAPACAYLGRIYDNGEGVPVDDSLAASLYERACDGDEISGCNNLGGLYASGLGVDQDHTRGSSLA